MNAQEFYNRMEELKEQSKAIHEEMNQLMEAFYNEYQLFEFLVEYIHNLRQKLKLQSRIFFLLFALFVKSLSLKTVGTVPPED